MSGKKSKINRKIQKYFIENLDEDTYLLELGAPYFSDDEEGQFYLNIWYRDACLVRAFLPELDDEELMPPSLALILMKYNLMDFEAIRAFNSTQFTHE